MEDKVPVFKSWKGWYILLIAVLSFLITGFYLFSKYFA